MKCKKMNESFSFAEFASPLTGFLSFFFNFIFDRLVIAHFLLQSLPVISPSVTLMPTICDANGCHIQHYLLYLKKQIS